MAVWKPENIKMTSRGLEMLATVLGGDGGLTLTKVAVSQARHVGNLEDATGLESEVMELDIINVTPEKTGSSIEVQLNNKKNLYSSPFELHQIGVFMSHPNYGEQLYFIAQCEQDGVDFIPDYNETPLVLNYNLYIKHEGTSNVTINVSEGASTPLTDFNALKQRFEEHILTPHVTIQELEKLRELYTKVQIEQKLNEIKNGTVENAKKLGGKLASEYVTQQDIANFGGGDMTKAVYDRNNNGKVDVAERAESVTWGSVTGKPSYFPPSTHNHNSQYLGKNAKAVDSNLLDGIDSSGFVQQKQNTLSLQQLNSPNFPQSYVGTTNLGKQIGLPVEWVNIQFIRHQDNGYGTQIAYSTVQSNTQTDTNYFFMAIRSSNGFSWNGWRFIGSHESISIKDTKLAIRNGHIYVCVWNTTVDMPWGDNHDDGVIVPHIGYYNADGSPQWGWQTLYCWNKNEVWVRRINASAWQAWTRVPLWHDLESLKQLSVDGKNTHISGINRLLGYGSGLTTNNSWNDVAWWWEHKVLAENTYKQNFQSNIMNIWNAPNINFLKKFMKNFTERGKVISNSYTNYYIKSYNYRGIVFYKNSGANYSYTMQLGSNSAGNPPPNNVIQSLNVIKFGSGNPQQVFNIPLPNTGGGHWSQGLYTISGSYSPIPNYPCVIAIVINPQSHLLHFNFPYYQGDYISVGSFDLG